MKTRTWFAIFVACVALLLAQGSAFAEEHEFRYKAPNAKSVELMCEFNGWKGVPMTKGDDGTWTVKVTLPSGKHAYKFLVDGNDWVMDPNATEKKTVDGVENSAVSAD
jgi:1,4-alpha-glucan branching enzyme